MKPRVIITSIFTFLLLTTLFTAPAFGQSESGSAAIEGVVKDQNGAVVQGATVVIKNKDTNLERTVTTTSNGVFSASVLPVGSYVVTTKASGFAEAAKAVSLSVGDLLSDTS